MANERKRFGRVRSGLGRVARAARERIYRRRAQVGAPVNFIVRRDSQRRAVITGLGAVTCLGLNVPVMWDGLINGRSGIARVSGFDVSTIPVKIAGQVRGFVPSELVEPKESRRMARASHLAISAAEEALRDSGIRIGHDVRPERTAVIMGTAIGGFEMSYGAMKEYETLGYRKVNPFGLPAALPNAPGHHISKYFNAKGSLSTVVAACASGTQTVGDALELIRRGRADVVFAGGVDSVFIDGALVAFSLMRVLASKYNDTPEQAARPFDVTRDGFCYSEGAAVLMVEDYEHAVARGAKIYAEVLGMGVSSDAHHIAIPDPTASGAIRAMEWALEDARISPEDVQYVNAHGSGTQTNDPLETRAIKSVLGRHAYNVPINSIKSMMGHAMGASGAIEAMSTVLTIQNGIIPPTINLENPDVDCDLDYVPKVARKASIDIALSNSFGLGGQNATIALGRVA